jgi:methionyl aminopeptidase
MENKNLLDAIKCAVVHKKVGSYIRENIKINMSLKDIAILIENKIKHEIEFDINNPINQGIAFPVGLSVNNCVAHYTPNYNENEILLKETDIIKIDYGVHKNGIIIDSAFTFSFNSKYDDFINISKNLTNYATSLCGADVVLGDIGRDIEEYVKSKEITIDNKIYQLKTMSDLSGHLIKQYEIHAGKAVPNISIFYPMRMKAYEYYAIEPFLTTGDGYSILETPNSHYMLSKNHDIINNLNENENKVYDIIKENYHTLPFCQRWLYELDNSINYDNILQKLTKKKVVNVYPPIYDIKDSIISQFEHTIFIKENGIVNLTKNEYY